MSESAGSKSAIKCLEEMLNNYGNFYREDELVTEGVLSLNVLSYAIAAIKQSDAVRKECMETIKRLEEDYSIRMSDRLDASIFAYQNILKILEETT